MTKYYINNKFNIIYFNNDIVYIVYIISINYYKFQIH